MTKKFNVTADCKPHMHYMVDITEKLIEIKKMVDTGYYFTINRARQYGKTTTLRRLRELLQSEYVVVSLDFQMLGNAKFRNENIFSLTFAKFFLHEWKNNLSDVGELQIVPSQLSEEIEGQPSNFELTELFYYLSEICAVSSKPVVLLIDEVDSATNNQVFLDFLAQLRAYYINRDVQATFQSVILAGVYDVKNLKRKMRPEEEHKVNSPWNIAADFTVDMSFSENQIETMLIQYEEDYRTGMSIKEIAKLLYDYTSGYPFLVSRLCKLMDEVVFGKDDFDTKKKVWTKSGFLEAVKLILTEKNTLFESLEGKLIQYPRLKQTVYTLLFAGQTIVYNVFDEDINIAIMFGFIKREEGLVCVANRIFEILLYNYFLTSIEAQTTSIFKVAANDKSQFIQNGRLNMEIVLRKFVEHFNSIYGESKEVFNEEEGRRRFLLYLRPIINGVGNYYIEPQTRDAKRMDVVVDYSGEQFVIELKIWHGDAYHNRGEKQLSDYLDYFYLKKGYMLSYNFNQKKEIGVKEIQLGDKVLVEAVV